MFGQTYTAPLLLANAGKSAMKVLVAARPELAPWVTFSPDFGFIQVLVCCVCMGVCVGVSTQRGCITGRWCINLTQASNNTMIVDTSLTST